MGAQSSHHDPLERNNRSTSFRRVNSLRQSKSKGSRTSPRAMDKLRRSFRSSFRRRKETSISEASKPQIFQSDEADVRSGTCYFPVKYLGCVEVFCSRGIQICEEALAILKNSHRRPVKAILHVSGDGLRIVEDETKGLIVDQTLEKVSFCAPDRTNDRGFSYICRDGTTRRWLCHGFLAQRDSGERLSHAVGCAFAICLERKQKRDKECNVTMKFDVTNATFTRNGSFRQQSLTERLQDSAETNKTANTSLNLETTVANSQNYNLPTTTTTVININNNINKPCSRKDSVPVRTTPRVDTHAIERPHASISMLKRQGSYRGLSHLNQASPFKRQLSLRLSDLHSNAERTKSHSLELSYNPQVTVEASKNNISDLPVPPTNSSVANQVSAMCQQMSKELSFLSNTDDLFNTKNCQMNSNQQLAMVNTLTHYHNQRQGKPSFLMDINSSSSFITRDFRPQDENADASFQHLNLSLAESSSDGIDLSEKKSSNPSNQHSITPPTPPATPPNSIVTSLPHPDQWLIKVVQSSVSKSQPSSITVTSKLSSPELTNRNTHARVYSLGSSDVILNGSANDEKIENSLDIDWLSLSVNCQNRQKNTNPFLSNVPLETVSNQAVKLFEVDM